MHACPTLPDLCAAPGSVEEAREAAGNDMVALMTKVYPIVAQLTAHAIAALGYAPDGAGTDKGSYLATAITFRHLPY